MITTNELSECGEVRSVGGNSECGEVRGVGGNSECGEVSVEK